MAAGANIDLRTALYTDFAAHLMKIMQKPAHEYFRQFTGGVYWPRFPSEPLPVHIVTEDFRFITMTEAAKVRQLAKTGLQDLDTVMPGDWDVQDNI